MSLLDHIIVYKMDHGLFGKWKLKHLLTLTRCRQLEDQPIWFQKSSKPLSWQVSLKPLWARHIGHFLIILARPSPLYSSLTQSWHPRTFLQHLASIIGGLMIDKHMVHRKVCFHTMTRLIKSSLSIRYWLLGPFNSISSPLSSDCWRFLPFPFRFLACVWDSSTVYNFRLPTFQKLIPIKERTITLSFDYLIIPFVASSALICRPSPVIST